MKKIVIGSLQMMYPIEKIGFDSEYNEVIIFQKNKSKIQNISFNTKEMIAKTLVEKISNELKANG